jgi:hypothetical protein
VEARDEELVARSSERNGGQVRLYTYAEKLMVGGNKLAILHSIKFASGR